MRKFFAPLFISILVAMMILLVQPTDKAQSSLLLAITLTPTERATVPPVDPDLPKTGVVASGTVLSPWVEPATDQIAAAPKTLQPKIMENGYIYIDTSPLVRLEIPALGMRTSITTLQRDGKNWDISGLEKSAGWLSDTGWPGYGGNTVLAGHLNLDGYRGGPFLFLSSLRRGDLVFLYTEENQLTYQVKLQRLVPSTDRSIYTPTTSQKLTLLTCSNWNPNTQRYEKRLLVEADLVGIKGLGVPRRVIRQRALYYPE
jgi:LPXTG-site transpeptidase (sortase) family protein